MSASGPNGVRISISHDPELGVIVGVFDSDGVLQSVGSADGTSGHTNHRCYPTPIVDNDTPT